jgi:hypothetical protein
VGVRQSRGVPGVVPLPARVRGAERVAFGRHATPVARLPPRGRVRRGARDASRIGRCEERARDIFRSASK